MSSNVDDDDDYDRPTKCAIEMRCIMRSSIALYKFLILFYSLLLYVATGCGLSAISNKEFDDDDDDD